MTIKRILRPVRVQAIDLAGLPAWVAAYLLRHTRPAPHMRLPCGGRRRSDGLPCTALSVPGKRGCNWRGGCSTGPRTMEGKARVAANLARRRKRRPFTEASPPHALI